MASRRNDLAVGLLEREQPWAVAAAEVASTHADAGLVRVARRVLGRDSHAAPGPMELRRVPRQPTSMRASPRRDQYAERSKAAWRQRWRDSQERAARKRSSAPPDPPDGGG